jgi:hypothetical protein
VDGTAALELGHLGVGNPHQPPQLGLVQAHKPAEGTLDGDGGPSPQLRGEGVPQHLRLAVVAAWAERLPSRGSSSGWRCQQPARLRWGQRAPWRWGWQGSTSRPWALRVWTLPNDGAVKVTNSRGCSADPRFHEDGRPPGQAPGRGRTMTEASVSFAGNLTDDPRSATPTTGSPGTWSDLAHIS